MPKPGHFLTGSRAFQDIPDKADPAVLWQKSAASIEIAVETKNECAIKPLEPEFYITKRFPGFIPLASLALLVVETVCERKFVADVFFHLEIGLMHR